MIVDGETNTVLECFPEDHQQNDYNLDPYEASTPEAVLKWVQANLT